MFFQDSSANFPPLIPNYHQTFRPTKRMPDTNEEATNLDQQFGWQEEKEDMLMIVMVVLLMLLSVVIWAAFCIAVRKTARKYLELKRARRRQALITAAINRAASDTDRHVTMVFPSHLNVVDLQEGELPTYEEACHMSTVSPAQAPVANPSVPPYRGSRKPDRTLRIAPERPGSMPTVVLPPSYESSVRVHPADIELQVRPSRRASLQETPEASQVPSSSRSAYTISNTVQITEC